MQLERSRRSGWEWFVIGGVVLLSMWLSLALYAKRDRVFKERLLIWELQTLRNYVAASMLENRKMPSDLKEVVSPWSIVHGPLSEQDPFGSPYHYNPQTGWVATTTPGYNQW